MSDLFDEAITDYQEERKLNLYKGFLLYFSVATFVIVLALLLYNYYQNKNERANQYMTEILFSLDRVDSGLDKELYLELIGVIIRDADSNISELASFKLASFYTNNRDLDKAIKIYDKIIKDKKTTIGLYFAILQKLGILLDAPDLRVKYQAFITDFLNTSYQGQVLYGKFEIYKSLMLIKQEEYKGAIVKLNQIINNPDMSDADMRLAEIMLSNLSLSQDKK